MARNSAIRDGSTTQYPTISPFLISGAPSIMFCQMYMLKNPTKNIDDNTIVDILPVPVFDAMFLPGR